MMRLLAAPLSLLAVTAYAGPLKPSITQQIKLGLDAAKEIRSKEKVLPESDPRVALVRRVGQRLIGTIKKTEPWKFSFDVIQSKDINAFALPGGPTFVYTGLLDKLHTEDELASVMGHELTHCRQEHWARSVEQEQNRNLLLTGVLIFTRANNTVANVLDIGKVITGDLPYSRGVESAADEGGYVMMTDAGYNPQGMIDMFKVLEKAGGNGQKFLGVDLSDHPGVQSRINGATKRRDQDKRSFPPQTPIPSGLQKS